MARSNFHLIASNQMVTASGASPSSRLGTTSMMSHASASFGKLISTNRLPASETSERRLVLDASSSKSPRRGSRIGSTSRLQGKHARAILSQSLAMGRRRGTLRKRVRREVADLRRSGEAARNERLQGFVGSPIQLRRFFLGNEEQVAIGR